MSTKTITLTEAELTAIIANAVKAAVSGKSEKAAKVVPVITDDIKRETLLCIKNDPKTTNGKYYTTFAAFIIAQAVKKYGTADQVQDKTWLAAAKGYELVK